MRRGLLTESSTSLRATRSWATGARAGFSRLDRRGGDVVFRTRHTLRDDLAALRPRLDLYRLESSVRQHGAQSIDRRGTCDAAGERLHVLRQLSRHLPRGDDVRDGEAAAGLQDAEGLAEYGALVG